MGRAGRSGTLSQASVVPERRSAFEVERIKSEAAKTGLPEEIVDKIDNPGVRQIVQEGQRPKGVQIFRSGEANDFFTPQRSTYYQPEPARNLKEGDLIMDGSMGITAWEVVSAQEENGEVELEVRVVDVQSGAPEEENPFKTSTWRGPEQQSLLRLTVADHETRNAEGVSQVYDGYLGTSPENEEINDMCDQHAEAIARGVAGGDKAWERSPNKEKRIQEAHEILDRDLNESAYALAESRGEDKPDEERHEELRGEVLARRLGRGDNKREEKEIMQADIAFRAGIAGAKQDDEVREGTRQAKDSPEELTRWAKMESEDRHWAEKQWQPRTANDLHEIRREAREIENKKREARERAQAEAEATYGKPFEELDPDLQEFLEFAELDSLKSPW